MKIKVTDNKSYVAIAVTKSSQKIKNTPINMCARLIAFGELTQAKHFDIAINNGLILYGLICVRFFSACSVMDWKIWKNIFENKI